MASVALEHVREPFGKVFAVDDVSVKIKDKNFVALLGPSGCGKTTTLRLIAGLETSRSGDVHIGDRLVNEISPRDRNIAMVFQSYALYPEVIIGGALVTPDCAQNIGADYAAEDAVDGVN